MALNDLFKKSPVITDFKEAADKEQEELNESMKESFRQRDERKKKEKLDNDKVE